MRKITGTPQLPPSFALWRYGFVYLVHHNQVLVVHPNFSTKRHDLDFAPTTWASYDGRVVFYAPDAGIAQLSGAQLVLQHTSRGPYSAPYGVATCAGEGLIEPSMALEERNGLDLSQLGPVWRSASRGLTLPREPAGVMMEPDQLLVVTRDPEHFSHANGVSGKLLYAENAARDGLLDGPLVPTTFRHRGVLTVGFEHGYIFTPDLGVSWRVRRLPGWGVVTDRAILSVHDGALHVMQGWWV